MDHDINISYLFIASERRLLASLREKFKEIEADYKKREQSLMENISNEQESIRRRTGEFIDI